MCVFRYAPITSGYLLVAIVLCNAALTPICMNFESKTPFHRERIRSIGKEMNRLFYIVSVFPSIFEST